MKNNWEKDFLVRIKQERLEDIKGHIADDVKNDRTLTDSEKLAYGILHLSTKLKGYDTYSQKDLAEIFELRTKEVKYLMKNLSHLKV